MIDCIKTQRARNIITALVGKVIKITDEGNTYEKIITGIYGVGEIEEDGHLCLQFVADYGKNDGGPAGLQTHYDNWEQLINNGVFEDSFIRIEFAE